MWIIGGGGGGGGRRKEGKERRKGKKRSLVEHVYARSIRLGCYYILYVFAKKEHPRVVNVSVSLSPPRPPSLFPSHSNLLGASLRGRQVVNARDRAVT